jgi:hypothetical protein
MKAVPVMTENGPSCACPRLRRAAETVQSWEGPGDALAEARHLRLRSARLTDGAERRAALALRIALLGRGGPPAPDLAEALPDTRDMNDDTQAVPPPEPAPAPPVQMRTRAPRPERPAYALKDAASLLAALGTSDDGEWSNPDGAVAGRGMELSMPEEAAGASRPPLTTPEPEPAHTPRTEAAPPPAPITMTDLSLSILTGEFRHTPPAAPVPEDAPAQEAGTTQPEVISTAHRQASSRILEDEAQQARAAAPKPRSRKAAPKNPARSEKPKAKGKPARAPEEKAP